MAHLFGWCMQQAECGNCRVAYRDWNNVIQECSCSCHEGKEKPELPTEVQGATPNDGKTKKRTTRKRTPAAKKPEPEPETPSTEESHTQ